ncbi:gremlin-1-like [Myxocyprinus asiaticus]|uniref:gremlin-1-like n=1 Tax=Myxocyprinus asiaticus TaxID=70543 RepID=UPI0022234858|nr:gremlin-1-like [Myxocyprinus asiaticus]
MTKDAFTVTVVVLWLLCNLARSRGTGGFQGAIPEQSLQGSFRGTGPPSFGDEVLNSSHEALHVMKRHYLKPEWCKTQPLNQTINEDGCQPLTITNSFCYGQCNSFYIPRRVNQEDSVFQSCSMCKPKTFTSVTYTLLCPGQIPHKKKKRVRRIKQCHCTSVDLD